MAQKKCPKCGEDNPAEAVMCWACYASLSAGGAAAAPAGAAPMRGSPGKPGAPNQPAADDEKKKGLDPKMIGIGAGVLLLLGVGGFMAFGRGGGSDADPDGTTKPNTNKPAGGGNSNPGPSSILPSGPGPAMAPPGPSGGGSSGGDANPAAYSEVANPNPNMKVGTVGILPSNLPMSAAEAGGLAKFARPQVQRGGSWNTMMVFVFADSSSARYFATYQLKKHGARLEASDYSELAQDGVWVKTSAVLIWTSPGGREVVKYPSAHPFTWWQGGNSGSS